MTWYELWKFVHVSFAVTWVGGASVTQFYALLALKDGSAARMAQFALDVKWIGDRVLLGAALGAVLSGVGLVWNAPFWTIGTDWITIGLILFAVTFLTGALFFGPEAGRIAKQIEAEGAGSPGAQARIRRLLVLSRIDLVVLFLIIFDMVVKPDVRRRLDDPRRAPRRGSPCRSSGRARTAAPGDADGLATPRARRGARRRRPGRPRATCTARTTAVRTARRAGVSIFIASSTSERLARLDLVARRDEHPDHGARHRRCERALLSRRPRRGRGAASSRSGGACGAGRGQVEPPRAAPGAAAAARAGGAESGGCSTRNAVVVRPARTAGCATSQRRNGRFVVTPLDLGLGERVAASRSSASSRVGAVRDQLRDHRVVGDADLVALLDARVDADPGRQPQPLDAPGLREERARILGVEPHLDRVAVRPCHGLRQSGSPARDAELLARRGRRPVTSSVTGMLDLDAPVQLEEEEVAPVEHELGGARAAVADRASRTRPRRSLIRSRSSGSSAGEGDSSSTFWWRRWIEHSRSPSETTVPCASAEELDLDVARPLDVALAEDAVVAEGGLRLAPRGVERLVQLGRRRGRRASRARRLRRPP